MRTIKNLINKNKKVYIYLEDNEAAERFILECEREGITFSDKSPVRKKHMQDVLALLPDGTICYLGFCGRMCYSAGGNAAVRINFKEYILGNPNYIISSNNN